MAAQSGGFWRAGGTVALCGFWLLTGLLPGEFTPAAAEPPAVEMWQGNRRVGQPTPTAPAPLTLQPVPALLPRPADSRLEDLGQTLPPIRASDLPAPSPTTVARPTFTPPLSAGPIEPRIRTEPWHRHLLQASHHLLNDCENAVNACVGTVSTSTGQVVEALAEVTEQSMTAPGTSTVPGQLATTPGERAPHRAAAATGTPAGEPAWPWVQIATLAFVVTMPFALAVGLALILRWSGMKFRVEIINSGAVLLQDVQGLRSLPPAAPQAAAGPPDLDQLWQTGSAEDAADQTPLAPPAEEVFTGEYFDVGPTFEEERLLREQALLAGERAVLQQVYEENLRLQQEIRELGPDLDDDLPTEEEAPVGYTTPPDADECNDAA